MPAKELKFKQAKSKVVSRNNTAAPAQNTQLIAGKQYVLTARDYNLLTKYAEKINEILARSRIVDNARKSAPAKNAATAMPAPTRLTDAMVKKLTGRTNVVYYNYATNAWNANTYNGYTINDQKTDTVRAKEFKTAMDKDPEFAKEYEMAATVTMTINSGAFKGAGKPVAHPRYSRGGTVVVGNIIVKNKKTNQYELYGKSWIGVNVFISVDAAVNNGARRFAFRGARDSDFRAAVLASRMR